MAPGLPGTVRFVIEKMRLPPDICRKTHNDATSCNEEKLFQRRTET